MTEKNWKAFERRVATYIGGGAERVPVSGRARGDAPDIAHPWLSVECKYRSTPVPNWITDALAQAEASKQGVQMPVVIIGEKGQRARDAILVCRLQDFRDRWL